MAENPFKTPIDDRAVGEDGRLFRVWKRFLANIETLSKRQAANVTLGNADGEIGGLTVSNPPTQVEVEALRDKTEELADDVRAIHAALLASDQMKSS